MDPIAAMWEDLVVKASVKVDKHDFFRYLPNVCVPRAASPAEDPLAGIETFDRPGPWDRTMLELEVENPTAMDQGENMARKKASLVHGMDPRSSSMVSGHTDYHRLLEEALAEITKKEACLVTPTGFAANTTLLATLGNIASFTCEGKRPAKHEKIAIFSDALNHASIIDGLRMVECHQEGDTFVYRHNDMKHLDDLLSNCQVQKKAIITDSCYDGGQEGSMEKASNMEQSTRILSADQVPRLQPIISLVVGSEQEVLHASNHMLESSFHVTAIRPPAVPANACRLRVTLNAAHTSEDIRRLVVTLSQCVPSLQNIAID